MKKHSVIAFASALTIAAGTLGASVFAPAAAFDAESNQIEAAVRKDGSLFAAQDEDGIAYEDAIADLYARSTTISDKEILEIARKMKPDCTAVAEELGDVQAAQIMDTLADYEEAKASYLLDSETAQADSSVSAEWTRQDRYTRMGMSSAQKLTSLIPGYTVTSCSEENGQILVDIDEWMTEGYTEGADQNTENVSAYRYYFTAVLSQDSTGNWEVASITNTDRNFTWLEDIEEQEKNYEGEDSRTDRSRYRSRPDRSRPDSGRHSSRRSSKPRCSRRPPGRRDQNFFPQDIRRRQIYLFPRQGDRLCG